MYFWKCLFPLMVVKMKSGIMKMVKIKFPKRKIPNSLRLRLLCRRAPPPPPPLPDPPSLTLQTRYQLRHLLSASIIHHHELLHQFSFPCHHLTYIIRHSSDSTPFSNPARYENMTPVKMDGYTKQWWWWRADVPSFSSASHVLIDPTNKTNKIRFKRIERDRETERQI